MTNATPLEKKTGNETTQENTNKSHASIRLTIGILGPLLLGAILYIGLGGAHYTLIFASILAYMTKPLVGYLSQKGIQSRWICLGFTLVISCIILLFLLVQVPIALSQLISLLSALPKSVALLSKSLQSFLISKGMNPEFIKTSITDNLSSIILRTQNTIVSASSQILSITLNQVSNLLTIIINLMLFPMLYYTLLRHHKQIGETLSNWLPEESKPFWNLITDCGSQVLSGYIRGQGLIILSLSVLYIIGLQLLQIPFATLIGALTGALTIIPYVGFSIGLCLSLIMGATVDASATHMASILGLFATISILENVILIPQLIGHHLDIHPVIALLAIIIGGNCFGISGFIFAVPVSAMVKFILKSSRPQLKGWFNLKARPVKSPSGQ